MKAAESLQKLYTTATTDGVAKCYQSYTKRSESWHYAMVIQQLEAAGVIEYATGCFLWKTMIVKIKNKNTSSSSTALEIFFEDLSKDEVFMEDFIKRVEKALAAKNQLMKSAPELGVQAKIPTLEGFIRVSYPSLPKLA